MVSGSQRSREETRDLYKKLGKMANNAAVMMSVKHDYNSLKELTQSNENLENIIRETQEEITNENKLTQSEYNTRATKPEKYNQ